MPPLGPDFFARDTVTVARELIGATMTVGRCRCRIYKIYGVHFCLNFTTEREGVGAVLIRAGEPLAGIRQMAERRGTADLKMLLSGPGRLCQALAIDTNWNALPLGREIKLTAADPAPPVVAGPRIGITQATELEWRFCERDSLFISRTIPRSR